MYKERIPAVDIYKHIEQDLLDATADGALPDKAFMITAAM